MGMKRRARRARGETDKQESEEGGGGSPKESTKVRESTRE